MNLYVKSANLLLIVLLGMFMTACGSDSAPVALEPIQADKDTTGFMRKLAAENDGELNLLEAVILQGVPPEVAAEAFLKYDQLKEQVAKTEYMTVIDFTQHSGQNRMYVINRTSGVVEALPTAHGVNSDPDRDGIPQFFSNIPGSKMSSLGAYLVSERYVGKYGASMRMDGLESTNDQARERAIVLHPARYVKDGKKQQGESWGCPAVPFDWITTLITRLRDGSYMYIYGKNSYKETEYDHMIQRMSLMPGYKFIDESESAPEHGYLF